MTCTLRCILPVVALLFWGAGPLHALDEEQTITDFLWQTTTRLPQSRRPTVALVLGGGGARGLAHIGVLKVFEEEKIPVDMVIGTSIGAIVGAIYAAGIPVSTLETLGETTKWNTISNVNNTSVISLLLTENLLSTKPLEDFLNATIAHKRFDQLDKQFMCVAADIMTGERVILREGDVGSAARASATIPGLFAPVAYRHRYLVDGGLVDNLPTDIARSAGADVVIAVSVASDISKNRIDSVLMMLIQAIYVQGRQPEREKLLFADIVIRPDVGDVTAADLDRSRECIDQGVLAARRMVPQIKKFLIDRIPDEAVFQ